MTQSKEYVYNDSILHLFGYVFFLRHESNVSSRFQWFLSLSEIQTTEIQKIIPVFSSLIMQTKYQKGLIEMNLDNSFLAEWDMSMHSDVALWRALAARDVITPTSHTLRHPPPPRHIKYQRASGSLWGLLLCCT